MSRIISITFLLIVCSCSDSTEIEMVIDKSQDPIREMEHQFALEKENFMKRPDIKDSSLQDSLFANFIGVWKFIYTINDSTKEKKIHEYSSVLFWDGMLSDIDYPCSWYTSKEYFQPIKLTSDSIYYTYNNSSYLESKKYEFSGDTLKINCSYKIGEFTEYYVRSEYDEGTLEKLEKYGFNDECMVGKWHLDEIAIVFDTYDMNDEKFAHVPRTIDFTEYKIEGDLLINREDNNHVFKIVKFYEAIDQYGGLWLRDIQPVEKTYDYRYRPFK